jgi:hypothetical protein
MSEDGALGARTPDDAPDDEADDVDTDHLDGVEPGAGCTEIWEHLSERREEAGSD